MKTRRITTLLFAALLVALHMWNAPTGRAEGAPSGSVTLRVYQCPPGMTAETLDRAACGTQGGVSVYVALTTPAGDTLGYHDATLITDTEPFALVWDGLPFGTHELTVRPHEGPFSLGEAVIVDPDTTVTIDAGTPDAAVTVYHLFPPDSDGDGLSDAYEGSIGTDPADPDTDGDGLPDVETRVIGGDIPACDPLDTDTDDDGLGDREEVDEIGTLCTNADTDGNGFPDGSEVEIGTDPLDPDVRPAPEGGFGALIVRARLCPAGWQGTDFAAHCTAPLANATFSAASERTPDAPADETATDANGVARFTLPAGPIAFAYDEVARNTGSVAIWSTSCANAAGDVVPVSGDRNVAELELAGADVITCAYFVVPAAEGDPSPSPAPKPSPGTGGPVTRLPNTGIGATMGAGQGVTLALILAVTGGAFLAALGAIRRRKA